MAESEKGRGRPKQCRRIRHALVASHFAPNFCKGESVDLGLDELEALRLTDLEELYQVDAAQMMNVSRQTLGRILKSAHKKVADSLINGKRINIHGGNVRHQQKIKSQDKRGYCICPKCGDKTPKEDSEKY